MGLLGAIGAIAGNLIVPGIGGAIGGALGGALDQSQAGNSASYDQRLASDKSLALQKEQADRTYNDQAPYRKEGVNALGQLATAINTPTTAADVMADPGYQFGLDQGNLGVDRKIAQGGGRVSGNAIKAASRFATNYATAGYGAADQRRENRLARLQTLAGLGQSGTSTSGANAMAYGQNAGATMVNQGDNAGRAQLYNGGVWANAGNQIAAAFNRAPPTPSINSQFNLPNYAVDPG